MKKKHRTLNKFRSEKYVIDDRNYILIEESCYKQFMTYFVEALLKSNDLYSGKIKNELKNLKPEIDSNFLNIGEKLYKIFRDACCFPKGNLDMTDNLMIACVALDPICKMIPKKNL